MIEHQTSNSGFEETLSIQKKVHAKDDLDIKAIPMIADGLVGEPLCVSPCNYFDSSSARLDNSFFS